MNYPYWLVTWTTGRWPAPPMLRHTPMAKLLDSGKIGGRRYHDEPCPDRSRALHLMIRLRHEGRNPELWVVERHGAQRRRVQDSELETEIREHERARRRL